MIKSVNDYLNTLTAIDDEMINEYGDVASYFSVFYRGVSSQDHAGINNDKPSIY